MTKRNAPELGRHGIQFEPRFVVASHPLSARQAIRSQAAAREYVERQLAQAQTSVHDLRTKLFHARQEKDRAMEAARSATARKVNADRKHWRRPRRH